MAGASYNYLRRHGMKTYAATLVLLLATVFTGGCAFLGGAAAGAAGAGAGYEYRTKQQLDRLKEDYEAGKMTREEYDTRKKEIEGGSIIY